MVPAELAEYFAAERHGGFVLVALALTGFGFAAWLWIARSTFLAMVWPLLVLGTFQLAIGLVIAIRSPAQITALDEGLRTAPAMTVAAERDRMQTVNRNFGIVKAVEGTVIIAGLAMAMWLPLTGTWAAVGLGLVLEAAALLVFDAFAHQRALVYAAWLADLAA